MSEPFTVRDTRTHPGPSNDRDGSVGELEGRVASAVQRWLVWLPRWSLGSHRVRSRPCRLCFGSPVVAAAGIDRDVPHMVQHALATRIMRVVESSVDRYVVTTLSCLDGELSELARRKAQRSYRAQEGLAPEYQGLDLDPEPNPHMPFLFTLEGLEHLSASEDAQEPRILSEAKKRKLREEIAAADEFANLTGTRVCRMLENHGVAIRRAIDHYVEPQITRMLEELERELSAPGAGFLERESLNSVPLFDDSFDRLEGRS